MTFPAYSEQRKQFDRNFVIVLVYLRTYQQQQHPHVQITQLQ